MVQSQKRSCTPTAGRGRRMVADSEAAQCVRRLQGIPGATAKLRLAVDLERSGHSEEHSQTSLAVEPYSPDQGSPAQYDARRQLTRAITVQFGDELGKTCPVTFHSRRAIIAFMTIESKLTSNVVPSGISRRLFLQSAAMAGAALPMAGVLAARADGPPGR